jgi:FkbM family methyltransferase
MIGCLPLGAFGRAIALLIGDRGRVRKIAFRAGGRTFRAHVNEDTLWVAVKDVLVLSEYERAGIELTQMRGTVVDVGAHLGLFSLLASAYADKVLAFEAHPENFASLSANIARNGSRNIDARHCAVWSEAGEVTLVEGPHSGAGSILEKDGRAFAVQAETLDSIVAAAGPVDLLKLDIEGAEFDVLDHTSVSTLGKISAIVAELHLQDRSKRLSPTLDRLRDAGFDVVVRQPPIAYWRETMLALARNRGRLRGEHRLRLTVAAVYSLVALIRPFLDPGSRPETRDQLAFLYARQTGARPALQESSPL